MGEKDFGKLLADMNTQNAPMSQRLAWRLEPCAAALKKVVTRAVEWEEKHPIPVAVLAIVVMLVMAAFVLFTPF